MSLTEYHLGFQLKHPKNKDDMLNIPHKYLFPFLSRVNEVNVESQG